MAMKVSLRKNINIGRVVAKITGVIIALYVGGTIVQVLGTTMNNTASPFYKGLTLIGWTVTDSGLNGTSSCCHLATGSATCGTQTTAFAGSGCITQVSGSGILAVIGIIGIATVVLEFVNFSM